MAKKRKDDSQTKTYVITSAQGIQNPYSALMYGRNSQNGKPNIPLIKNIEKYVTQHNANLQICAIPGSYRNEIELDSFFHERNDVYIDIKLKERNEQNKDRERLKRNKWEDRKDYALGMGREFSFQMPMHYFWKEIPETDYKKQGQRLNSNIRIVGRTKTPQNKNPLNRAKKLTQKFGGNSIILASPKQRLVPVASGQAGEYPKLMLTTGCCTHPSYNTSNDLGREAQDDHEYGFVSVDILNNKHYLPRVVNAQKNGTFIDLGIKYEHGKKPSKAKTLALVVGDSHVAEINPKVEKANKEMIKWFEPKHIHYNDVFAARSINLHELEDTIATANKFAEGKTNLREELILTAEYIMENALIAQRFGGEVVINYSNHDDMLYRWLTKGFHKKDKENFTIGHRIIGLGINRYNAFEKAIKDLMPNLPNNVTFLKPGEDRIYSGYQCAAHGHLGKNGARGNLTSLIEGYESKVVMGHVHQLELRDGSMSVGTSAKIPLEYQLGQPSTSMAGNGVIYERGLLQAIPIIKSHWAKDNFAEVLFN